jgi:hypothetical protein
VHAVVITRALLAVLLSLAATPAPPAVAADDDLAQRIDACTREQDDARRLACFDRAAAPKAVTKRISATVTAIEKRPRGELVITLDNGQVWAQKEAGAYFPLKVGDPVAILAGTLGSFRLIAANRATAVTQVQ